MSLKPKALTLVNITDDFLQFLSFWGLNPLRCKDYNQTILWLPKNINKILLAAVKWSQVRHSVLIQEPPSQFFISLSFAPLNAQFLSIIRKKLFCQALLAEKICLNDFLFLKWCQFLSWNYAPLNDIWLEIMRPIFQRCSFICIGKKRTYNCPCKSRTFICKWIYVDVIMLLQYMDWGFNLLYK